MGLSYMKTKQLNKKQTTVKDQMHRRLSRSRKKVFVPADFEGIASYRQILRVLKQLVGEKKLVRLGQGVYAKARVNQFDNNLYPDADAVTIGKEILKKFGVAWEYSQAVKDYNERRSTQVPVRNYLVLKGRFRRNIEFTKGVYANS
jgi:hypothetical protein